LSAHVADCFFQDPYRAERRRVVPQAADITWHLRMVGDRPSRTQSRHPGRDAGSIRIRTGDNMFIN